MNRQKQGGWIVDRPGRGFEPANLEQFSTYSVIFKPMCAARTRARGPARASGGRRARAGARARVPASKRNSPFLCAIRIYRRFMTHQSCRDALQGRCIHFSRVPASRVDAGLETGVTRGSRIAGRRRVARRRDAGRRDARSSVGRPSRRRANEGARERTKAAVARARRGRGRAREARFMLRARARALASSTARATIAEEGARAWRAATQTIFVRFASKKQGGSSSNGRDSNPKFLGLKRGDGEVVRPGHILARQRGTKWHPGTNCGIGKDHTLFALVQGKVCFSTDKHRGRKLINVAPLSKTHPKYVEGVA